MKRYIEHLKTKEPHERRAHALRGAVLVTAALFFVWITTLSVRLAVMGQTNQPGSSDQLANVIGGEYAPNTLEVATTSDPF
ncbi:hypothetical protein KW798_01255 [Candidatus Parcubacteria bacterium]|nr:hypothetical protein [Candidatus Parcubacteria bacterium]